MNLALVFFFSGCLVCIVLTSKFSYISHKAKHLRVQSLLQASNQWLEASKEDDNCVSALLHASSARAYLNAARSLMPDEELNYIHEGYFPFIEKVEKTVSKCVRSLQIKIEIQKTNGSNSSSRDLYETS